MVCEVHGREERVVALPSCGRDLMNGECTATVGRALGADGEAMPILLVPRARHALAEVERVRVVLTVDAEGLVGEEDRELAFRDALRCAIRSIRVIGQDCVGGAADDSPDRSLGEILPAVGVARGDVLGPPDGRR